MIRYNQISMEGSSLSRREFLSAAFAAFAAVPALSLRVHDYASEHPTPRPGIDAARVSTEEELNGDKDAIEAFNEVRQIPQIVDGIRCSCGCAKREGNYSLLSCYEKPHAMARWCGTCKRLGRYVYKLHSSGKSLDEIREAVDKWSD